MPLLSPKRTCIGVFAFTRVIYVCWEMYDQLQIKFEM